jgi:thymidylate kinase
METQLRLLREWNNQDILYCHWKSNEHLHEGILGHTDLDILIDPTHISHCTRILSETGYIRVSSPRWGTYPGIEDWIGYDEETKNHIHIHLHTHLLTGRRFVKEVHLPWEKIILQTRIKNPETGVYITDPTIETIILSVRIALKTTWRSCVLPPNILREIAYLAARADLPRIPEYVRLMLPRSYADIFARTIISFIGHSTLFRVCRLKLFALHLRVSYGRFIPFAGTLLFLAHTTRIVCKKILRMCGVHTRTKKILQKNGIIIAVIGADGSGKSTLIKNITPWLAWKLEVRSLYLGKHPFFSFLSKKRKKQSSQKKHSNRSPRPLVRILLSDVKHIINAHHRMHMIRRALHYRVRGYIVITDRFPQKQFRGINDAPSINPDLHTHILHRLLFRYEAHLYAHMIQTSPDMTIILLVSPEVAVERKPDHDVANISEKTRVINQLSFPSSHIFHINTDTHTSDNVLQETQKAVWEYIWKTQTARTQ